MLLIHNNEPKTLPLHFVLQEGMCTYQNVNSAAAKQIMEKHTLFLSRTTCQQCHVNGVTQRRKKGLQCLVVLVSQNLRRRHNACLKPVINRQQAAEQSHQRLARTDIPLQQAVHLMTGLEVLMNLADNTFLRIGQFERKRFVQRVETVANQRHPKTGIHLAALLLAKKLQLDVE